MKIGTIAGGVGTKTTISLNYLPQFLKYIPVTQLTSIQINVLGDGILTDLDTQGIDDLNEVRKLGFETGSTMLALADGKVINKNVEINCVNATANPIDLYDISLRYGTKYIQNLRSKALASSGIQISNFHFMGLGNAVDGDLLVVDFRDNFTQRIDIPELKEISGFTQNEVAQVLDNYQKKIMRVTYTPAADTTIYVSKVVPIGNLSQPIN